MVAATRFDRRRSKVEGGERRKEGGKGERELAVRAGWNEICSSDR